MITIKQEGNTVIIIVYYERNFDSKIRFLILLSAVCKYFSMGLSAYKALLSRGKTHYTFLYELFGSFVIFFSFSFRTRDLSSVSRCLFTCRKTYVSVTVYSCKTVGLLKPVSETETYVLKFNIRVSHRRGMARYLTLHFLPLCCISFVPEG